MTEAIPQPQTPATKTNRIVVGVDGSEHAEKALGWAIDEAKLRDAHLVVVHAWHLPYLGATPLTPYTLEARFIEEDAERVLAHAVHEATRSGLDTSPEGKLIEGSAARALVDEAATADLLVVGARGRGGFTGLLLGSTSQQVSHHARCPIVIVPT